MCKSLLMMLSFIRLKYFHKTFSELTRLKEESENDREYFTTQLESIESDSESSKEHLIKKCDAEKRKLQGQLDQVSKLILVKIAFHRNINFN